MELQVNGHTTELPSGLTARGLLESMELAGKRVALEVNGEILPRSRYDSHQLKQGDKVEIVHAIGGG